MYEEKDSPQEEQFVVAPRRKGKEPIESSSRRSSRGRDAPNIMQSMPLQHKIVKRDRGLAHEVCPNTPEHLVATFHRDQRSESICPTLAAPRCPLVILRGWGRITIISLWLSRWKGVMIPSCIGRWRALMPVSRMNFRWTSIASLSFTIPTNLPLFP